MKFNIRAVKKPVVIKAWRSIQDFEWESPEGGILQGKAGDYIAVDYYGKFKVIDKRTFESQFNIIEEEEEK